VGVLKAVLALSSSANGICQNPLAQSSAEKYRARPNLHKIFRKFGKGKLSPTVVSFSLRKSTHIRNLRIPDVSNFLVLLKWLNSKDFDLVVLCHPLASFEFGFLPLSGDALESSISLKEALYWLESKELKCNV